jgi:hypothetical protein
MTQSRSRRRRDATREVKQTNEAEQKFANTERKNRALHEKLDARRQERRGLHSRMEILTDMTATQKELEAEINDLKSEVRELTRANREHARKNEALQAANAKLR